MEYPSGDNKPYEVFTKSDVDQLCEELVILLEEIENSKKQKTPRDDHYGFMIQAFANKMTDHAHSVMVMIPKRDCILIARSMIEGLATIYWAKTDPGVIPLRWRHYYSIAALKAMRGPNDERCQKLQEWITESGERFVRKDKASIPWDNPNRYKNKWHDEPIGKLIETYLTPEFVSLYGKFSDWQHWGPLGLGQALYESGDCVKYTMGSRDWSCLSVMVSIECVIELERLRYKYFEMDFSKIEDFRRRILKTYCK